MPRDVKSPTFDEHNYPTEETLETIKTWPWGEYVGLVGFLEEAVCKPYGSVCVHESTGILNEPVLKVRFVTGGWSGNEDIIAALHANFGFWLTCWESTTRGGLWTFEVPR